MTRILAQFGCAALVTFLFVVGGALAYALASPAVRAILGALS